MLMVKHLFPFFDTPLATRLWQITMAILAGACGNIILVLFLSSVMSADTMAHLLDWILGFNTALTGYMLVEKAGANLRFWRYLCAGAGIVNTVMTILVIAHLSESVMNLPQIHLADAGILLTIGTICGALGGLLARKYQTIKGNNENNENNENI